MANIFTFRVFEVMVFASLVVILAVQQRVISQQQNHPRQTSTSYHHNVNIEPEGTPVLFAYNEVFEDMSASGNERWKDALLPGSDGFIWAQHNETLAIEYGISMFHALHCLQMVRSALQPVVGHGQRHQHVNDGDSHFLHQTHIPHCLSYLVQVSDQIPYRSP